MDQGALDLASMLAEAHAILLVTGAGISTETGIPDFRGPSGIWKTQRPVEFHDFIASHDKRIEYWNQKLAGAPFIEAARPGGVHLAAAQLESAGRLDTIVTQNVDGLHSVAGSSRDRVVEIHGTVREAACLDCGARSPIEPHLAAFKEAGEPPACGRCGGWLKPATISFGQQLDPLSIQRAVAAAERCDAVVALGTTLSVYPAADIPLHAARRGVPYAIVNQGLTEHDHSALVSLRIEGEVGPVFSEAVSALLSA